MRCLKVGKRIIYTQFLHRTTMPTTKNMTMYPFVRMFTLMDHLTEESAAKESGLTTRLVYLLDYLDV